MRALISVYNKNSVAGFAKELTKLGWDILSTGGTAKHLEEEGIEVLKISQFTKSPEILSGRVKTLHPKIFAGLLARKNQYEELTELGIPKIDLVCINLYPFQEMVSENKNENEILENIDIGGVSLIRAAAKNYKNVITICSIDDYAQTINLLKNGSLNKKIRKKYALKAFETTAQYDTSISRYFSNYTSLRYGENPHQKAELYGTIPYKKIAGEKELSFNNYADMDAAFKIVKSFEEPISVIVKHNIPCGAAVADNIEDAFIKSLNSDSMSAFGGIIGLNRKVNKKIASEIIKSFFEVVIAPDYSKEAITIFNEKPNMRIVQVLNADSDKDYRKISGGFLVQDIDNFEGEKWKVVTKKKPTLKEMNDLKFAWKIAGFLKSNAIVLAKDGQTLGLGSGETARIVALKVALMKLEQFFGKEKKDLVMASDGFFPFADVIYEAAEAGITHIVQPGGSKNDEKVISAADEFGIAMIFTGRRHFLH